MTNASGNQSRRAVPLTGVGEGGFEGRVKGEKRGDGHWVHGDRLSKGLRVDMLRNLETEGCLE